MKNALGVSIALVAVRYFGGVKLGVAGLIRSYKTAALDAVSNSEIIIKIIKEQIIHFLKEQVYIHL